MYRWPILQPSLARLRSLLPPDLAILCKSGFEGRRRRAVLAYIPAKLALFALCWGLAFGYFFCQPSDFDVLMCMLLGRSGLVDTPIG